MKRRWGLISLNTSLEGIMAGKYFVFSSRNKVSINFERRWFSEWNRCFLNGRSLRAITQRICKGNRLVGRDGGNRTGKNEVGIDVNGNDTLEIKYLK
ncbi:hypothetical protein CDAR_417241 [Caerostris darwini]|uniref:Uncharacterized protein n=1 Tax=Caerostris darwini TaxID=1538125 RepID=A0AAV4X674_9ARAC|nr:hypothetical protein CDAR_417241 [Caerostris darwini]